MSVAVAFGAGAAEATEPPPTLSDSAKQAQMLQVIEKFVPRAETFWHASDLKEAESGYFSAAGSGVSQARGDGDVAYAFATLLTAKPEQATFGGVSRATLLSQTIQVIRHEALTNKLSGAGYNRWGEGEWQSSMETYGWGFAAHLEWSHLNEETKALVKRVVTGEANILITKEIASGEFGNTGAEDNGWNSPTPELAALMWPEDTHAAEWLKTAKKLAINASSTTADKTSSEKVDGVPLSEWNASVNLHPDLTLENHGFFNPAYQMVTHLLIGDGAIFAGYDGKTLPEAFSFRAEEVWKRVLGPMISEDGDIIDPAGQDWTSKDYQHLDYLSIMATRFHRADASVAESQALTQVAKRQSLHTNGSILEQTELGYETMLIQRLSAAWWNHHLFGPSKQPTAAEYEAAQAQTAGVHQYSYVDMIDARQQGAFTSMSFDDVRPMGLIVPRPIGHESDPILAAYVPGSLIGSASTSAGGIYHCDCGENYFSTAGLIGTRDFSMTSFPDGTTLLLDRGTGSTFNIDFESIPGLTGERPVYSASGTGIGTLTGNWWDVADRMGMVIVGGGGIKAENVAGSNPYLQVMGSNATGSGNRGAAVFPNASHETVSKLASAASQPSVPEGWSALKAQAPDGSDRFAVARWAGVESTSVTLTDSRGAPVTGLEATIEGNNAVSTWSLATTPASHGEEAHFLVAAEGGKLSGHALNETSAILTNDGTTAVHTHITWAGAGGTQTVERTIAAGEQVTARVVAGKLVTTGPEYESLVEARSRMEALKTTIASWQSAGTIDAGTASSLTAAVEKVLAEIGQAITADTAATPATATAATAVENAIGDLAALTAPSAPASVRERLESDRTATATMLEAAITKGLSASLRLEPIGHALPGEPVKVRAFVANRSAQPLTSGSLSLHGPSGWTATNLSLSTIAAGELKQFEFEVTASGSATPGTVAQVEVALAYTEGTRSGSVTNTTGVTIDTLITVRPATASTDLPLARGGWNQAAVVVTNAAAHALSVTLTATPPSGVAATPTTTTVSVPAAGSLEVTFGLTNASLSSGTGTLQVGATASGQHVTTNETLHYSNDLALNALGAKWPAISASSSQSAYPAKNADDGNATTFWVSAGSVAGEGPSSSKPVYLTVDHGAPVTIASVTMVPRGNYGPKSYLIQTSEDGKTWKTVATVSAPNSTTTTTFGTPVTGRWLRLEITDSWDSVRPPRNVQVMELEEKAP